MKIVLGCDHAGLELKDAIIEHLNNKNISTEDFGIYKGEKGDYPNVAKKVSSAVAAGDYDRGILICGTGVGMAMSANKVRGVRAVVCSEPYSALMSREHNDSNVLAMGQRVVGEELAKMIVDVWVSGEFEGERHQRRVDLITDIENENKR